MMIEWQLAAEWKGGRVVGYMKNQRQQEVTRRVSDVFNLEHKMFEACMSKRQIPVFFGCSILPFPRLLVR